jgi:NAD/NADP transhydrogenase alpha subunit
MGKLIGLGIVGAAVFLGAVVIEVTRRIKEEKERASASNETRGHR